MSRTFDPLTVRAQVLGDCGLSRSLNASFEKTKNGGLGGSTQSFLSIVVKAHLVGIEQQVPEILAKTHDWIRAAISREEQSGGFPVSFLKASHYEILALCVWLREGRDDMDALQTAVRHWNEHLEANPKSVSDPYVLGQYAATYLEAKAYHDLLRWVRLAKKIPVGAPCSAIRSPASVGGAVALHHTEGTYTQAEISRMMAKLLNRHMSEWLTTGADLKATRWLKLVYSHPDSNLSPRDVILKAYDHLPKSSRA